MLIKKKKYKFRPPFRNFFFSSNFVKILFPYQKNKNRTSVLISLFNREEKSLRHVAIGANFWMTTNQNDTLKADSHCFKLHRSFLTSFNLSNVGELLWVKSEKKRI